MNEPQFTSAPLSARPRTTTVLALLAITAAIFSYLGAYAMANTLVAAEVLKPWPKDHDPRPKWFLIGFIILIALFFLIAASARYVSQRQLKQIDEMEEIEE